MRSFASFLHDRGLVPERLIPFYEKWVSSYLEARPLLPASPDDSGGRSCFRDALVACPRGLAD